MTLKEFMERVGSNQTGKVSRYLKDALEQVALDNPDYITNEEQDMVADKRNYPLPADLVKLLKVCVKIDGTYEVISRLIGEPKKQDKD